MRRRLTIKLVLLLVSLVPEIVAFAVDHAPRPDPPAAVEPADASC